MDPTNRPASRPRLRRAGAVLALASLAVLGCMEPGLDRGEEDRRRVERPAGVPRSSLAFRIVLEDAAPGTELVEGPEGTPLTLAPGAVLTERDITLVEVGPGQVPPEHAVYVHLSPEGAGRLRAASREHVGRRMVILVDGGVLLAPQIRGELSTPAVIENRYTREAATRVAERLAP